MIVGFFRSTQFALQNIVRNWWLSLTTTFILVLTLLSITLVGGINVVGNQLLLAIERKVDINLYFYEHVKENEMLATQAYFQSLPEVAEAVYVSKSDALESFRARHSDDPAFLESLKEAAETAVPASLVVHAKNINDYDRIAEKFRASQFYNLVEGADFDDSQLLITRIGDMITKATNIGLVMSAVFVIIAIIVIFNMIRLTIYSHREEVAIMKLVGATNWFVRAPFILEAMGLGIIAALVTIALFGALIIVAEPSIQTFFVGYDFSLQTFVVAHLASFILGEILIAVTLTIVSSMIAISRYLKI